MGLAQSSLSNMGVLTPIEFLASTGAVAAAQVGYNLARLSDGPNYGTVCFGGVESVTRECLSHTLSSQLTSFGRYSTSKFIAPLTTVANVNTQGFWEAAVDDVSVDGQSLGLEGRTAILDTGTSLIVVPQPE
jgi:hypothetical protein